MKQNLLFALSLIMVSALTLVGAAQEQMNLTRKTFKMVTLPCQIKKGGDVSSSVLVTNNSGYTIPVNTKVYVEIAGASTPNLQQSVFANNTTRQMYGPADHSGSCTAKASVAMN